MRKILFSILSVIVLSSIPSEFIYGDVELQRGTQVTDDITVSIRSDRSIYVDRRGGPSGIGKGSIQVFNVMGEIIYLERFDVLPVRIVNLEWFGLLIVHVNIGDETLTKVLM